MKGKLWIMMLATLVLVVLSPVAHATGQGNGDNPPGEPPRCDTPAGEHNPHCQDDDNDDNNDDNGDDEEEHPVARLLIKPPYPKDNEFVFICDVDGGEPNSFNWYFGDGQKLIDIENDNVFHRYEEVGKYKVRCEATNGDWIVKAKKTVKVKNIPDDDNGNDNDDNNDDNGDDNQDDDDEGDSDEEDEPPGDEDGDGQVNMDAPITSFSRPGGDDRNSIKNQWVITSEYQTRVFYTTSGVSIPNRSRVCVEGFFRKVAHVKDRTHWYNIINDYPERTMRTCIPISEFNSSSTTAFFRYGWMYGAVFDERYFIPEVVA